MVTKTHVMRRDWDNRARKNAFHYIASWREEWDLPAFLASGEEDYGKLVRPVLDRCHIPTSGRVMVELGCGAGRMTGSFARRYQGVVAVDLSSEMLRQAREIHAADNNILWTRVAGADLAAIASDSADFVFSYLVLQHLPDENLVFGYVREMLRVVRPGGAFLFQFNGSDKPTMNLAGRLAWGAVDALWSAKLFSLSRALASAFHFDPAAVGKSWRGAAIPADRVKTVVQNSGADVRELSGEGTPLTWVCGVKHSASSRAC
jgi:ubiquinone/menaquinone biosynthesis C-methylase UbiE